MIVPFQFAYLQTYSRYAPFGGVSSVENLAEKLARLNPEGAPLAAALTDTFSLAGFPLWQRLLAESNLTALVGAEVGLRWGGRGWPYALLLLAESRVGYANLSRLLTVGLTKAGKAPLTATLDLDMLTQYKEGLIAIAPYSGGPVTALLHKPGDAKARAQILHNLFGPNNFFLGVPPLAAQPEPQTFEEQGDNPVRAKETVKLNAALVKLARDLKIGLVATGEARYAQAEEARSYAVLRGRLQRALSEQYGRTVLQQDKAAGQDWLYSPRPDRPLNDLHLRALPELLAHYNEADWPGALFNNRQIAARCAGWQSEAKDYLAQLRQRCESELARHELTDSLSGLLENELADIAELNLAQPLLAAATLLAKADPAQLIVVRRLSNSLVARLLGLTETPLARFGQREGQEIFSFEAYTGGRPLRLEMGQDGQKKLLASQDAAESYIAPVAVAGEAGEVPTLHPRQVLIALDAPLTHLAPLQPAHSEQGLTSGVQCGTLAPEGSARLEIYESSGVGRLQLALDGLNSWRRKLGEPPLTASHLPVSNEAEDERALLLGRLEALRVRQPAAYYAAAMSLAVEDKTRLAALAEQVRLAGLELLPPEVRFSGVEFSLEGEGPAAIRTGLGALLEQEVARQVVAAAPFDNLDDLISKVALSASEVAQLAWAGALDNFGEREQLAASADLIAATSLAWQEWQRASQQNASTTEVSAQPVAAPKPAESGQSSMFDSFDSFSNEPALIAHEKPLPLELAHTPPVSRLERLRRAYGVLGFLTAEYPLWRQLIPAGPDTSRSDPLTLAQVATQPKSAGPLLITGLIIGLRRLPIAQATEQSSGEELTVVQLQDFTGRAELLIPRNTPAEEVELAEGLALAALVRPLNSSPENQAGRLALVALALAPYPPHADFALAPGEETLDPEMSAALEAAQAEPPPANPTSEDGGWSSSLFESLGIAVEQPAPPPLPSSSSPQRGRGPKSNALRPPQVLRRVHIHLPLEAEEVVMAQLKSLLRQHEGNDTVILHLPEGDGTITKLEAQGLEVSYNEAFAAEVIVLLGPQGIKLEERTI